MNSYAFLSRTAATALFKLVALTIILTLGTVTMAPSAWSQDAAPASTGDGSEGGSASSAGMQAAAGLSTLIYLPLKAAFAICGGIVGGLTYAFTAGNENAAKSVWTTSMYGTYIITPDHLRGDKPIRFLGVPESEAPAPAPAPTMEPVR